MNSLHLQTARADVVAAADAQPALPPGWILHPGSHHQGGHTEPCDALTPGQQLAVAANDFGVQMFGVPAAAVSVRLADGRRCQFECGGSSSPPPPPTQPQPPAAAIPDGNKVLFMGRDAAKVVEAVRQRGPLEAKNIPAASGVERSKCYVLVGDLAERGLIRDTVDGYVVAVDAAILKALTRAA